MIVRNGGEKVNTCAILKSQGTTQYFNFNDDVIRFQTSISFGTIHKSSGVGSWLSGCDSKV